MFDRTFVNNQSGPSKITVNENKAPTDDSIRLAEEYREKLRSEFIKAYTFGDMQANEMNGMVVQFVNSFTIMGQDLYVSFNFNNQNFEIKQHISRQEAGISRDEAYKVLFNCIMDKVRESMVNAFIKGVTEK